MAHLDYKRTTRAAATPSEWLAVGASIGRLANSLAERYDIVAYIGEDAGGPVAARFAPATAEVEINVEKAFGPGVNPEDIGDINDRAVQYEWPRATGAIFHEALHAKHSLWDMPKAHDELSAAEFEALMLLEEGRIEKRGIRAIPRNAGFLRACALDLVIGDLTEEPIRESDTRAAARLAALTIARVDAGSLRASDIARLEETIEDKIGLKAMATLRDIWLRAQDHLNDTNPAALYELAREWVAAVEEAAEENGEPAEEEGKESGSGSGGSGGGGAGEDGEDAGELSEFVRGMLDDLADAAEEATIGAADQLGDAETSERWEEEVKERASAASESKEHAKVSSEVFGKGTGPMPTTKSGSRVIDTRAATPSERAAAVTVARMLEKAKYRDRDATEIHSELPPGRLRTRAMVQGAALKTKGVVTRTEPWRRTVRKHVDDPTLNIGVMVDISGSMSDAMQPMATTAWVMSEAVKRVQGRAAMVYYGSDVFPTLKPGQHLDQVVVYNAPDGTEKFNRAFKALNGSLGLLNGSGARLLVVVSDGCYTHEEQRAAREWLARCAQERVGVLWLTFDGGYHARGIISGSSAILVPVSGSPESVATDIGRAAARALETVA
jgi:hypothetical protein